MRISQTHYIPQHNARFGIAARDPASAFVPLGSFDLDTILCVEVDRVVARDNTVHIDNHVLQLAAQPGRRTCAGLHVTVHQHLDGAYTVSQGARQLGHFTSEGDPVNAATVLKAAV